MVHGDGDREEQGGLTSAGLAQAGGHVALRGAG
jgi:hypothetical protein